MRLLRHLAAGIALARVGSSAIANDDTKWLPNGNLTPAVIAETRSAMICVHGYARAHRAWRVLDFSPPLPTRPGVSPYQFPSLLTGAPCQLLDEALPVAIAGGFAAEAAVEKRLHADHECDAPHLHLYRDLNQIDFGDRPPTQDLIRAIERHAEHPLDLLRRPKLTPLSIREASSRVSSRVSEVRESDDAAVVETDALLACSFEWRACIGSGMWRVRAAAASQHHRAFWDGKRRSAGVLGAEFCAVTSRSHVMGRMSQTDPMPSPNHADKLAAPVVTRGFP